MKSHKDSSSLSSLQQLIEELESLIIFESSKNGSPWISIAKLADLFYEKHKVLLEEVAKVQGCKDDLRSLFMHSRRFSIYGTQIPQEFYVALIEAVVPGYGHNQKVAIQCRIKKPRRIDKNLIRTLKSEDAEKTFSRQQQRVLECQSILISKIESVDDLESVLMEIIKSLTVNHPKQFATVSTLSRKFSDYYGQPIRPMMRSVCPDISLIDLLQTIPNLQVQKVNNDGCDLNLMYLKQREKIRID